MKLTTHPGFYRPVDEMVKINKALCTYILLVSLDWGIAAMWLWLTNVLKKGTQNKVDLIKDRDLIRVCFTWAVE